MSEPPRSATPLLTAPSAFGWSLALTVGLNAAGLLIAKLLGASSFTLLALAVLEVALYVGAASYLGGRYFGGPPSEALALGSASSLQLVLGCSLGVVLHVPAGALDALVELRFPTPRERMLEQLAQLTPASPQHALMLLVAVAVLAPFAEELFFRGALYTALGRSSSALVVTGVTSLAFVLAHQEPRTWAPLLLVALVLSELRRQSRSLWPGFALHAAFNATTLVTVFATRPVEPTAPSLVWPLSLAGTALCLAGLWVFGRVSRKRSLVEGGA